MGHRSNGARTALQFGVAELPKWPRVARARLLCRAASSPSTPAENGGGGKTAAGVRPESGREAFPPTTRNDHERRQRPRHSPTKAKAGQGQEKTGQATVRPAQADHSRRSLIRSTLTQMLSTARATANICNKPGSRFCQLSGARHLGVGRVGQRGLTPAPEPLTARPKARTTRKRPVPLLRSQ